MNGDFAIDYAVRSEMQPSLAVPPHLCSMRACAAYTRVDLLANPCRADVTPCAYSTCHPRRFAIHVSLLALYGLGGYLVSSGLLPLRTLLSAVGFTFALVFSSQGVVQSVTESRRAGSAIQRCRRKASGLCQSSGGHRVVDTLACCSKKLPQLLSEHSSSVRLE